LKEYNLMSGAAGIAAAKNRRSKPDPNQKPIISCSSKSGSSCPLPPGSKTSNKSLSTPFDEESLQIKGPMHLMQVLQVHEQRLNKIDYKLNHQTSLLQKTTSVPQAVCVPAQVCVAEEGQGCDAECYDRISTLEEKVHMLEEVIMNLQLTLTNVQSFAMETSLAMLKLQNQTQPATPTTSLPVVSTIEEPDVLSVSETN
jgi:hypothetical protein